MYFCSALTSVGLALGSVTCV